MSTPKHLEVKFQIKCSDGPTVEAIIVKPSQQLYIVSSSICCHLVLSYWTGKPTFIYLLLQKNTLISVNYQLLLLLLLLFWFVILIGYCCCCCDFDCILLLLCITQQQPAELQQQPE